MTKRLLLAAALLGFSTSALAAAPGPGPYYAGAQLGLSIFHDSDVSAAGFAGTTTLEYKLGFAIGAVAGYRYSENFRFEGEISYKGADVDKVGGFSQSGSLSTYAFMANAYYDFTQAKLPVTPFVGVGLGAIYGKAKSPGESDSDTAFGYQITAGILYAVNRQVTLSAAYRYQGSSDFSFTQGGVGITVPYGSSSLLAGLNYYF